MFYKVLSNTETEGKLFVPNKFLDRHLVGNTNSVVVRAGLLKQIVDVIIDSKLDEDTIIFSKGILKALSIPEDIRYQIVFEKNTIKIGPVIGLLMAVSEESLTRVRLRKLLDYCVIYPEIQGLIIAFSEEGIDFENNLVKGYYYNPWQKNKSRPWNEGIFPLPDSIFQRTGLSEESRIRLKKATKNSMFNSMYFNKWEFSKMVSKFQPFLKCIPETSLLKSIEDIDNMLLKHDAVYLKPVNGTLSRGLYKVTKIDGEYGFQGNQGSEITKISSIEEAENYIKSITCDHKYLIQQAIHPLRVDGRHMDFRVIIQKDHTLTWNCTGVICFVGGHGDICSNWGFTSSFEGILSRYFNFNQKQIFKKKQEIIEACKRVCGMLDATGENYADLGFDVIIDEALRPWVLEVNKRHYHVVPLWTNDTHMYYEVKSKPIKYAAAQSGFKVY
jgi:hypothetical protein